MLLSIKKSHRQPHADHAELVERTPHEIEQRQRTEQTDRDGDTDDRHGAPLSQEQEQHGKGHEVTRETESRQSTEPLLDVLGGILADDEVNPHRRGLLPEFLDPFTEIPAKPDQVGGLLLVDHDADRFLAVDAERPLFGGETQLDIADVLELRRPVGDDARLLERKRIRGSAVDDDFQPTAFGLQIAHMAHVSRRRDTAPTISQGVTPVAAAFARSTETISRRCDPPVAVASPTPATAANRGANT